MRSKQLGHLQYLDQARGMSPTAPNSHYLQTQTMKTICKSILIAIALLGFTSVTQAAPNIVFPKSYDTVVKSEADAAKLPQGSKIALSCTSCKTLIEKKCDDKKSWRDWFKPQSNHDCPGCGGKITYNGNKTTNFPVHTHVCSKCGDNSAFTCTGH